MWVRTRPRTFCRDSWSKRRGTRSRFKHQIVKNAADYNQNKSVCFTISNALDLPYKDDYFDAVFHFGGINLFGDVAVAIAEMDRVCKTGGNVLFGDESVASHLREHDYGKMFIKIMLSGRVSHH